MESIHVASLHWEPSTTKLIFLCNVILPIVRKRLDMSPCYIIRYIEVKYQIIYIKTWNAITKTLIKILPIVKKRLMIFPPDVRWSQIAHLLSAYAQPWMKSVNAIDVIGVAIANFVIIRLCVATNWHHHLLPGKYVYDYSVFIYCK